MLEVKDAVRVSLHTFGELFPSESKEDLRLEEVFLSPDDHDWKVTVSYRNPDWEEELQADRKIRESAPNPFEAFSRSGLSVKTRLYKTIRVSADSGSLLEIKSA